MTQVSRGIMNAIAFICGLAGLLTSAAASQAPRENSPLQYPSHHPIPVGKELLPLVASPDEVSTDALIMPTSGTTLESYPDPLSNPVQCNRRGHEVSNVCDPDHTITYQDADRIDARIGQLRKSSHVCGSLGMVPYSFAVALVKRLPIGVDGDTFATELLERWGVGHKECHDGIILLHSKEDNVTVLRWKQGVEPVMNFKIYAAMQSEFRAAHSRKPLGKAIYKTVDMVVQHLTGEILPPRQTPQLVVLLTIFTVVGLLYCACIVTVLADQMMSTSEELKKKAR